MVERTTTDEPWVRASERWSPALRCALCHEELAIEQGRACADCRTVTHGPCADEARACPTLGCRRARRRVQVTPSMLRPLWTMRPRARSPLRALLLGIAVGVVAELVVLGVAAWLPCEGLVELGLVLSLSFTVFGGYAGAAANELEVWLPRRWQVADGRLFRWGLLASGLVLAALGVLLAFKLPRP